MFPSNPSLMPSNATLFAFLKYSAMKIALYQGITSLFVHRTRAEGPTVRIAPDLLSDPHKGRAARWRYRLLAEPDYSSQNPSN